MTAFENRRAITARELPLLVHTPVARVAWWHGQAVDRPQFLGHVRHLAQSLPASRYVINLCEDRYLFLVTFAAIISRRQTNLLPPSRTAGDLQAVANAYPDSYRVDDAHVAEKLSATHRASRVPLIPADHTAAIVFTSGSTERSRPHPKLWGNLVSGTRLAQQRFGFGLEPGATVVATVPAQHMYGLETSILAPLLTGISVHSSRPFFPADLLGVLQDVPEPRILITTPVHLRACVAAIDHWPRLNQIISATAPLARSLAIQAERVMAAPVLEIYGCTETGSLASRHTANGDLWEVYPSLCIDAEGRLQGSHLPEPVALNDVIERLDGNRFRLLGRHQDLVNMAGKRASLIDLNRRLLEIPGVEDGVFLVPSEDSDPSGRLAALVVAPGLSTAQIVTALAEQIDPVFLPRPLRKVARLPRNETGKLPRQALLDLLHRPAATQDGP